MNKSLILNKIKKHYSFKSDAEFARFLEIKPQTLSSWYSRNTYDIELLYAKCIDIDGNFLLTGQEPMLKNDIKVKDLSQNRRTKDPLVADQMVPLYDIEATAGLKVLFDSSKPSQVLDVIHIPNLPKCDGAVTVTGDSMYPLLKSGDMVLYKEIHVESIFYGEMYLLGIKINGDDEYITVKYVQRSEIDNHIKLVSQNPHHSPKDVPIESIQAIALIKASIRINTMI